MALTADHGVDQKGKSGGQRTMSGLWENRIQFVNKSSGDKKWSALTFGEIKVKDFT